MLSFVRSNIPYKSLKFARKARKYSKLSYIHNPGTEPLRPLTLGKLLEQTARKHGHRPAIISRSQNQTLTFQEVLEQADKLAAGFKTIGLNVGDMVGIWAPNLIEWYITHMACARGGFVLVNINPAYQPLEMQFCVNKVGVKAIICTDKFKTQNYYDMLTSISPEISQNEPGKLKCTDMPTLESIILCSDTNLSFIPGDHSKNKLILSQKNQLILSQRVSSWLFVSFIGTPDSESSILISRGTFNFHEILELATENSIKSIHNLQDYLDPDNICHMQFTSGTTGQPKAAVQTHFHIVNNSYFTGKRMELDRKHHKICVQGPLFHAYGTNITINSALNHGSTLVLPAPGYDPEKSLDAIRDEKCTLIHGTPTMYVDLVHVQKNRNEDISPEIAVSGGASCSPHLFKEMKEILKLRKVKSVYGLTEVTAVAFQSLYDDDEYQSTGTVGYIGDHLEAKVVDEKGNIVPIGSPGELCLRGYSITLGYWQDVDRTRELIGADRWLKTGDQFILEENGYGRVVGRLKEMIIRGGENIFPKEIEDFLNTHPHILETHVVGIPHERLGEEVCAYVRIQEDISLTLDDIKSFCKGKIAYFKIPSDLRVVKSFPKTTSGKIQKYKLG